MIVGICDKAILIFGLFDVLFFMVINLWGCKVMTGGKSNEKPMVVLRNHIKKTFG